MQFKNFSNYSYKYIYLSFSLILSFWAISLFEFFMTAANGIEQTNLAASLGYKLLNDFWAGLGIGLLFSPLYLLFFFIKKSIGNLLVKVLFSLIVIAQFALVKYSLTTLINLGADILGYSLDDMYTTVTASESMSFLYFLPFVMFPLLYFGINYALNRFTNERQIFATAIILVTAFGSLKMIFSEASETVFQNKLYYLGADIYRYQQERNIANAYNLSGRNDYPLLKPFKYSKDVLSPFFNIYGEKPNIVIIIVEGLGGEFVGKNEYSGFTPYLDSLISKSLYWENFVSNTGRTFGVVPSILGSLPYGEKGFLELNPLPSHFSLISVLKANEYTTSFYTGDDSSFDRKINFLEYNGIDHIIDQNKFGKGYVKTQENSGGFSWGYPDAEIFKKTLSELDGKKQPRLDIVMTLSNHEPFEFPSKSSYLTKVDSMLHSKQIFKVEKKEIIAYKEVFASLLYTDKSIENFMKAYAERPEYNNTIFIITGDHRLIPIAQKDKLCRFQVPLLIFSPMLKKAEKFKSISSHWDITPSLLSFLMNNYKFNKLKETSWMSNGLDTARQFRNIHKIPLMRYKGTINDYIYNDYFYADGELYKINENFGTRKVNEPDLLKIVSDSLLEFKKLNAYLIKKNKIFPDSLNSYTQPAVQFTKSQLATIDALTKGLSYDKIFIAARDLAFKKEYKKARLLCDYILNEYPNYADARTLKGRTFAWEGNFKTAEEQLLNVMKRTPFYDENYLALLDLYWWSKQDEKALNIAEKAKEHEIKNPEIGFKLAQAHKRMNNLGKAIKLIDSILKLHPKNQTYLTFKNSLK
ncbi:MAG: sulfatase-like hydrolase/transferase [Lutibacter sp.]|nr:sulfatase-like hydrolase/transferase [Lutibacter sp.]